MKAKKVLAIILTVAMTISIVACGSKTDTSSTVAPATSETGEVTQPTGSPALSVQSDLYGTACTNGYTTLKTEEPDHEVIYDDSTSAVMSLSFEDGTKVDDSLIDTSEASVSLEDGDGYYVDDFTFAGDSVDATFENGQLTYKLSTGDIEWKNPDSYAVDNGGLEWSCQGGNGNGVYTFNLAVNGIKYDGVEIDPATFRAVVYIYGREFSSTSSPDNPGSTSRWGAGGYDSVELPLPESKPLEEEVAVGEEPVWTWIGGDGTYDMPIICDYSGSEDMGPNFTGEAPYHDATDNFYISWPTGIDASTISDKDVTITLNSEYGDKYVLTPNTGLKTIEENGEQIADGEYSIFASEKTTQVAVNMVYWSYVPVYTTMTIEAKLNGQTYSNTYDIGSVYTYMVQLGGGLDYEGTVCAQTIYGIANWNELTLKDIIAVSKEQLAEYYYTYAYSEGQGMNSQEVAWLHFNQDGTYEVTTDKTEATQYPDDKNEQLINHTLFSTNHVGDPIEAEYNGAQVTFSKSYSGNTMITTDKEALANVKILPGYVQSYAMMWGNHMRWPWLYFNDCGWLASEN